MSGYIYTIFEDGEWCTECGHERNQIFSSTRKYEATRYLGKIVSDGHSLHNFNVTRARDGIPGTSVDVDVYEFMKIDLGEE